MLLLRHRRGLVVGVIVTNGWSGSSSSHTAHTASGGSGRDGRGRLLARRTASSIVEGTVVAVGCGRRSIVGLTLNKTEDEHKSKIIDE